MSVYNTNSQAKNMPVVRVTGIGEWCNGSTTDSDSVCWGSNPYPAATKNTTFVKQTNVVFFERSVPLRRNVKYAPQ